MDLEEKKGPKNRSGTKWLRQRKNSSGEKRGQLQLQPVSQKKSDDGKKKERERERERVGSGKGKGEWAVGVRGGRKSWKGEHTSRRASKQRRG